MGSEAAADALGATSAAAPTGSVPSRCPECGRDFNPADPRTTLPSPKRPRPRRRAYAALALLVLGLLFVYANGFEPRRVGRSWTHWRWLGDEYGYRNGLWLWRGLAYGRTTLSIDGLTLRLSYHAGIAHEVEARRESDAALVYSITRTDPPPPAPPTWRVEVAMPDQAWSGSRSASALSAFNTTRESIFGVQISPRRVPVLDHNGLWRMMPRPDPSPAPFTVEGTEADVLWKFCEVFDLVVDIPERVPRRSDGWHPVLKPGEPDAVELQPRFSPSTRAAPRIR